MNRSYFYILILFVSLIFSEEIVASPFYVGQSIEYPKIIKFTKPDIPVIVVMSRVNGKVTIDLNIDSSGSVTSITKIAGPPFIKELTKNAVLSWQFESAPEKERSIRLIFEYSEAIFYEMHTIKVLPYNLELKTFLVGPPDTVSYIPGGLKAGEARCQVHGSILEEDKVDIR